MDLLMPRINPRYLAVASKMEDLGSSDLDL